MTQTTARTSPMEISRADMPSIERTPPHDLAAEMAVIGSMIIDPVCIAGVLAIIDSPKMFYRSEHGVIFSAIQELSAAGKGVDGLMIWRVLKVKNLTDAAGGESYFGEVANSVPSSAMAEYYAGIVRETASERSLIVACTDTLRDVYDSGEHFSEVLAKAERRLHAVSASNAIHANGITTLIDAISEELERIDRGPDGIPTGFVELDNILASGLQKGEMIVVAARPSHGKTAWGISAAINISIEAQKPRPGILFSLEMSKGQISQRILSALSGVDMQRIRNGSSLSLEEKGRLRAAMGVIANSPLCIEDGTGLTISEIRSIARRAKNDRGLEYILLDYLQLIACADKSRAGNREQEISEVSRGIKGMARELNVPVVVLCQLNRASEIGNRLPRTSDLRESGAIEQDADTVMLLHREAVLHRGDNDWFDKNPDKIDEALMIVAKQRNGPCDIVKMTFSGARGQRFYNYNPGV